MRNLVLFIGLAMIVAALAACSSRKSDYWGNLSRNVGDVIERR